MFQRTLPAIPRIKRMPKTIKIVEMSLFDPLVLIIFVGVGVLFFLAADGVEILLVPRILPVGVGFKVGSLVGKCVAAGEIKVGVEVG